MKLFHTVRKGCLVIAIVVDNNEACAKTSSSGVDNRCDANGFPNNIDGKIQSKFKPLQRELVFDIDLDDYNDVIQIRI